MSFWLNCFLCVVLVNYLMTVCHILTSSCFLRLASASFLASSPISSLTSRSCLCRRLFCSFSRFSLLLRWSLSSVSFSRFSLRRATRLYAVIQRRYNNGQIEHVICITHIRSQRRASWTAYENMYWIREIQLSFIYLRPVLVLVVQPRGLQQTALRVEQKVDFD